MLNVFVPDPLMLLLRPLRVTVLVPPVKVPLFVQFPAMRCANDPPPNVVDVPMETLPLTVNAPAAVNETDVPDPRALVRFPAIVIAPAGMVLTAVEVLLVNVKLPYDSSETV